LSDKEGGLKHYYQMQRIKYPHHQQRDDSGGEGEDGNPWFQLEALLCRVIIVTSCWNDCSYTTSTTRSSSL